jgi:hypothetical protein
MHINTTNSKDSLYSTLKQLLLLDIMHLQFIFLLLLLVGELSGPAHGLFEGTTVQDYMDSFVDEEKFRQHGITDLNETTRDFIWSFFKAFHQRTFLSDG